MTVTPQESASSAPQTVQAVAEAVRSGSLSVDDAVSALASITPSSSVSPPPDDVDAAYAREEDDGWAQPSDENNPNRLFRAGPVSFEEFQRMHAALLAGPPEDSSNQNVQALDS